VSAMPHVGRNHSKTRSTKRSERESRAEGCRTYRRKQIWLGELVGMSDLVTRLRMQANSFSNLNFWIGHEPSLEETAIITDLREAADRIADLELALVELSQMSGSPSNVDNANVLASRVRWTARRALEYRP
jgi:hypothetical protein